MSPLIRPSPDLVNLAESSPLSRTACVDRSVSACRENMQAVTEPTILGNGWVAAPDPSSGRTYYANTITGATSWEYPAEL